MTFQKVIWVIIYVPTIVGILRYKHLSKAIKYPFFFTCYGAFNETLSFIFRKFFDFNNTMPQAHIYSFVTILILALFYRHIFGGSVNRKIFNAVILGLTIYSFINAFYIQSIWDYPSLQRAIGSLFIMIFSILYFRKIMEEAKVEKLFREPLIWINTAVLFYFAGTLFFNILFNISLEFSVTFTRVTIFYFSISNLALYLLFTVGFWKSTK